VVIYGFMTPMFGVVFSAILLGEAGQAFSLNTLLALALVCAGIVCVNKFGSSTKVHK
jgi:drug/metabolite transporter (DMT)-like permease